jgi:putative endonuclease
MKSYLYILKSQKNKSYYTGITSNIDLRLKFHNTGNVKATRYKRPYKLVFKQEFDNINTAHKAELKIKSWKRRDFIEKIIKDGRFKLFMGR